VDGERYSIVTDYLGTPCAMLDQFGRTVWSASISIYGDLRNLVGDRHACPFRWPGQYEDQETGYCYNRWRYYDAREGEFISQDPLKLEAGTTRLVGYPLDPLKAFDPLGLKSGAGYDHVTYQGIKNGRAYTGYASAPSSMGLTPEQIVSRRYGGNFSDFGGQPPSVRYSGSGIEGKSTARGLEQRLFERDVATLGRNNVANLQNPVGINNPRRTAYLQAADKKLGLCG
jgi:RHS repeat-associated protein